MKKLLLTGALVLPLAGCTFGGILEAKPSFTQDWTCAYQGGVCARTDTIDDITIQGIGGDPALAGPVSGYPEDGPYRPQEERFLDGIEIPEEQNLGDEYERQNDLFIRADYSPDETDVSDTLIADFLAFSAAHEASQKSVKGKKVEAVTTVAPRLDDQTEVTRELNQAQLDKMQVRGGKRVIRRIVSRRIVKSDKANQSRIYADRLKPAEIKQTAEMPVPVAPILSTETPELKASPSSFNQAVTIAQETELVPTGISEEGIPRAPKLLIAPPITDPVIEKVDQERLAPKRKPGKIMPIRMSAFVDANGVFHEATTIWIEVEQSGWATE